MNGLVVQSAPSTEPLFFWGTCMRTRVPPEGQRTDSHSSEGPLLLEGSVLSLLSRGKLEVNRARPGPPQSRTCP